MPLEKSMAIDDVADRAESYGFDGVAINGNDVLAVYQTMQGALKRARAGDGPTLIECKTYRWHGHSEHDKAFYRTNEEAGDVEEPRSDHRRSRPICKGMDILTAGPRASTSKLSSNRRSTMRSRFAMDAVRNPRPPRGGRSTDL